MKRKVMNAVKGVIVGLVMGGLVVCPAAYGMTPAQDVTKPEILLPESNANHGNTLKEVLSGIRYEKHEYAVAFYGEHKVFEFTDNDDDSVDFSAWWPEEIAEGMVGVHNHPLVGSLSYTDLEMLCRTRLYRAAIIVDSENVYQLSAPDEWPTQEELQKYFDDRFGFEFLNSPEERACINLDPEKFDDLVRDGYFFVVSRENGAVNFTSKLIEEYAEWFGLDYTVESLE